jgi:hypothetical protein
MRIKKFKTIQLMIFSFICNCKCNNVKYFYLTSTSLFSYSYDYSLLIKIHFHYNTNAIMYRTVSPRADLFSSTLSCNKKEEKNHQTSLPQQLIHPPSSHKGQRGPHTPPPLLSMVSSDAASWPRYGHPRISQTVRLKPRPQ